MLSHIANYHADGKWRNRNFATWLSFLPSGFDVESKPQARRLAGKVDDFFREVPVLPWTETTSEVYGRLRAEMRRSGRALQPLDMLIAAHALEAGATLVSSDRAFRHVPGPNVEDWTE
jgi:tRNA(fMet)-specific endonuclease VapC